MAGDWHRPFICRKPALRCWAWWRHHRGGRRPPSIPQGRHPHPTMSLAMSGPVPFDRPEALGRLTDAELDVVVVGGGVTGAGVALDAAARGLRTALVERDDFASGTSSRSSRLIHGGVRYLEHGHLRLVFEASRERRVLLRLAPHLVRPLAFTWPVY